MANKGVTPDLAEANVAVVRSTFDALNRRDIDGWVAPLAPDVEVWDNGRQIATNRNAFQRFLSDYLDAWEYYRETPEQLIPTGDRVVALVRAQARGRSSQVVVEQCQGEVHTVTDGSIVKVELYPSYADALEAAGLPADAFKAPAPTGSAGSRAFRRRRWRR